MTDVLERQLVDLARRLEIDPDQTLVDDVLAALDAPAVSYGQIHKLTHAPVRRRRVVMIGAMLAAASLAIVFAAPGPRRTVANWFGIGSTRIDSPPISSPDVSASTQETSTPETTPPTFPSSLRLGEPTTAADASARTGLRVGLATSLGEPAGIYVVSPPASGQIIALYPPSPALPASPVAGVGALLSTVPGTITDGLFVKVERQGTMVETLSFVTASGATVDAVWLSGEPHEYFFIDRNDDFVHDTIRLATNTLLWLEDDVTYRLEADISREQAVDIARTVQLG